MSDSGDADAERAGVFVRDVLRQFALDVAFCDSVLGKAAVLFLYRVHAVGEACDAVADFEVLGDFGADLHDGAHVVAADGAAFALRSERFEVDVLPVRRMCWFPR